ncbi:MAG: FecR domain-containing protein, partial [Gemmataceae bacterium]
NLQETQRAELQEALLHSAAARRRFWEYTQQHAMIGELLAEAQGRLLALEDEQTVLRLPRAVKGWPAWSAQLLRQKPFRWAALVAASLLVGVFLLWNYRSAPPPSQADLLAQLEEVQGDVFITTDNGEVRAEKGGVLLPGAKLKTGRAGSMVVLRFRDRSRFELSTDTVVRLLSSDQGEPGGKQIFLEQGELQAEVTPQPEGYPLILSTPEAVARVVGTRFRSLAVGGSTRIELEEGQLLVTRKRDQQSVAVPSGTFVVADAGNTDLKPVPLPAQVTKPRTLLVSRGEPLIGAAYTTDGRLVTATANGWLESYQFGKRVVPVHFRAASDRYIRAVAISPDGTLLAAAGSDGRVKIRDVAIGHMRTSLENFAIDIDPKSIGPDGKLLVSAGHLQFRSIAGGLAFSPDSKSLAVVEKRAGYAIKVYDTDGWKPRLTLASQEQPVVAVAFAPDGQALASADANGATIWDLTTRQKRLRLAVSGNVRVIAFSPDGRWLAGAGNNGTLKLWDARTGKPAGDFPGLFRRCYALAFSPDSRMLATAHEGHATLWDVSERREIATFRGHSLAIFALSFSPDGRTLATAGWERYVRLWDISDDIRDKVSARKIQPETLSARLDPPHSEALVP